MSKVLIIKLGYSETLDPEISEAPSLGDVLRTTVLLHAFKNDDVSWLTDEKARCLLEGVSFVKRVLIYNLTTVLQLQAEQFDTVINLEKIPGICALSDSIKAWKRYGFRFDGINGVAQAYDGAEKAMALCLDVNEKKKGHYYWQEALMEIVGKSWSGEEYILGYHPKTAEKYDIGFNWAVGRKWKNKAWPKEGWLELERLIGGEFSVSWQEGLENLSDYMDWVNSCRLVVTNDSLGLHLAIALKKKIVALYGPNSHKEMYFYGRGEAIVPSSPYDCVPCLQYNCHQPVNCMNFIEPERVFRKIREMFKGGRTQWSR